jgi:hypothetical protein
MGWLINLLKLYAIAAVILVHCSLFYCHRSDCLVGFTKSPLPPFPDRLIHSILSTLPISMRTLQAIAHLLLIGDVLFLIALVLNFIGSILKYICVAIVVAVIVLGALYLYAEHERRKESMSQGWGEGWGEGEKWVKSAFQNVMRNWRNRNW